MLSILGGRAKLCDGITRREVLRVGGLAFAGLTQADILRQRAAAAPGAGRGKSVIMIWLRGGASHLDSYDMKPNAPAEIRGEFKPIPTNVPGIRVCEHMPQQAKIMDKLAVLRGIKSVDIGDHTPHYIFTGFPDRGKRPVLGSVVSYLRPHAEGLPPYVSLMYKPPGLYDNEGPTYTGPTHRPFVPRAEGLANLSLAKGVTMDSLKDRRQLLKEFDTLDREVDGGMAGIDTYRRRAFEMIASPKVRQAFDVSKEPAALRERYGKFCESFLMARRLVEAGVSVVTAKVGDWDTHEKNFIDHKAQLPQLDQGFHALVTDLHERGLDKDVAVVMWGEFGRAPRISRGDGRDHWPEAGAAVIAGGGFKVGQAIGETDAQGGRSKGTPYTPSNILASLYHHLGIDPARTIPDHDKRPMHLLDDREPVRELEAGVSLARSLLQPVPIDFPTCSRSLPMRLALSLLGAALVFASASAADFPDPLVMQDGTKVATKEDWTAKRKPELKELFQKHMYGRYPDVRTKISAKVLHEDEKAFGGIGTLREVELSVGVKDCPPMYLLMAFPNERPKAGAPVFVGINFSGNHTLTDDPKVRVPTAWMYDNGPGVKKNRATAEGRGKAAKVWPLEQIVKAGYGVVTFYSGDIDPDTKDERGGMRPYITPFPKGAVPADFPATIVCWAWGVHRAVDHIVTQPEFDAKRIAAVGHSRLGKTVLLAAAFDERIAVAFPHQAGCGGTAPSRTSDPKAESVKRINASFPHWFSWSFKEFGDDPSKLPFDQHSLLALCAPRPVMYTNATEDQWANPKGQFEMMRLATPVYKLLGVEGLAATEFPAVGKVLDSRLGYWIRDGKHEMNAEDWKVFLAFADKWMK